jgi:uncharacterized protein YcbX
MAHLERLTVYPLKGLDPMDIESAEVLDGGTLQHDREFALFNAADSVVNGKQLERVHELSTTFDPAAETLHIETVDGETRTFSLDSGLDNASAWFSEFFDRDLTLRRNESLGFVDRRNMGPSVISTASLEAVASWFDDLTVDGARRRLRANIEIGSVPAFWEDRFVGDATTAFEIDDVRVEGVTPCARCVVPQRDPDTGEPLPEFRERFVERREATFPVWADGDAFDHYYTLMIIARIPEKQRGATLDVGDDVRLLG